MELKGQEQNILLKKPKPKEEEQSERRKKRFCSTLLLRLAGRNTE